jgi:hypothetical protein
MDKRFIANIEREVEFLKIQLGKLEEAEAIPSVEDYKFIRRYIESSISNIEIQLEKEKQNEKIMKPIKYSFYFLACVLTLINLYFYWQIL